MFEKAVIIKLPGTKPVQQQQQQQQLNDGIQSSSLVPFN